MHIIMPIFIILSHIIIHLSFCDALSLNEQSVDITINNRYAVITYSFEFKNDGRRTRQIEYEIGINPNAYVSGFVGEINGEKYKGITKEKNVAKKEYNKAIKKEKNAMLISQDHDANIFKIQTNLEKSSKAILNVTVEQLLSRNFGFYELSLDMSNSNNIDTNPKFESIAIKIDVVDTNKIQEIDIPFGKYKILTNDNNHKKITALIKKRKDFHPTYFIFRYKNVNKNKFNKIVFDPQSNIFLHSFGYDDVNNILPRRVVFILDKSGSMYSFWKQAQEAVIGAISNIKLEIDKFGIILFSTDIKKKRIRFAENQNVIDSAIKFIHDTEPGGGTNLYSSLETAIKFIENDMKSETDEFVNQIILVTDGAANVGVIDPEIILKNVYVKNSKLMSPISIFGIGISDDRGSEWVKNLNYPLIRSLSVQNGGFDVRIKQSDAKKDLEKYYKILQSPQLSNINITYSLSNENYKIKKLTNNVFSGGLYSGSDIVVCGKIDVMNDNEPTTFDLDAIVSAKRGLNTLEIQKEFELDNEVYDEENILNVERIWAYLLLQKYEKLLLENIKMDSIIKDMIDETALPIALKYEFVTPWTSMIIVEQQNVKKMLPNYIVETAEELVEPLLNGNRYDNLYMPEYDYDDSRSYDYANEVDDDYDYDDYDYDFEQTSGILLLDVTPLSLGIETNNGFTQRIIEKNSVIPSKKSILIKHNKFPVPSDPFGIIINIVQGERSNADNNMILGSLLLKSIENINYGNNTILFDIEIIFEIDANGILKVTAMDIVNGNVNSTSISADKGRPSQEEIDEMLDVAQRFAKEDMIYTETINAKNALESAAYIVKNELDNDESNLVDKMSQENKTKLQEIVNKLMDWIDDNSDVSKVEYDEKKKEFNDIIDSIQPLLKGLYQQRNDSEDCECDGEDCGPDECMDDDYYTDDEDL